MTVFMDPDQNEAKHLHRSADFAGRNVLEIGCGDGRLTWLYAAEARHTAAIDPDAESLRAALIDRPNGLRTKVSFQQASSLHLPFRDRSFDLAIFAWSL